MNRNVSLMLSYFLLIGCGQTEMAEEPPATELCDNIPVFFSDSGGVLQSESDANSEVIGPIPPARYQAEWERDFPASGVITAVKGAYFAVTDIGFEGNFGEDKDNYKSGWVDKDLVYIGVQAERLYSNPSTESSVSFRFDDENPSDIQPFRPLTCRGSWVLVTDGRSKGWTNEICSAHETAC